MNKDLIDANDGDISRVEPYEDDTFAFFIGLFWALKWTAISGAILVGVLSWVLP